MSPFSTKYIPFLLSDITPPSKMRCQNDCQLRQLCLPPPTILVKSFPMKKYVDPCGAVCNIQSLPQCLDPCCYARIPQGTTTYVNLGNLDVTQAAGCVDPCSLRVTTCVRPCCEEVTKCTTTCMDPCCGDVQAVTKCVDSCPTACVAQGPPLCTGVCTSGCGRHYSITCADVCCHKCMAP